MASSTTLPPNSKEEQPFPISTISISSFVSSKLREDGKTNNYSSWKEQMLCFIESQNLLEFILDDGKRHSKDLIIQRTDRLVKGWILGALDDNVLKNADNLTTARDVWLELENKFGDHAGQSQMGQAAGNEFHHYLPLYRATVKGDWTKAVGILKQDSNAIIASLNSSLQTTLHIAIGTGEANDFVKDLLDYTPNDLLGRPDKFGYTALHVAAQAGNTDAARILVGRRPDLLHQPNNAGEFPVHVAAISARIDTLEYLISETKDNVLPSPYQDETGLKLLCNVIDAKAFDIALRLAESYPEMSKMKLEDGSSALKSISLNETAAEKEKQLGLLSRLIFRSARAHWERSDKQAIKLVKCLCENMESLDYFKASAIYEDAILTAARLGNHKMIEVIVATFPAAIYTRDKYTKQTIFHVAAENRHDSVFRLIGNNGNLKNQILNMRDSSGNTFLHSAARLSAPRKLNLVNGAALKMQYEVSWFKTIEKIVQTNLREATNNAGKTPWMVFTEEHARLKAEGEKWIKDIANACIVVAALIATVSFAAVITVPGGNDSSTGHPLLSKKNVFKRFFQLNMASFSTSITSLFFFISSITSRYAEQDFLLSVPMLLSVCFSMLFYSAILLLVALSLAAYLLTSPEKIVSVPDLVIMCIPPVLAFTYLQIPLFVNRVRDIKSNFRRQEKDIQAWN